MAVEDRKGMLAALSARVAEINTNITNLEATTGDSVHATVGMTVEIRDMKHLEKVIKSLRGVEGRARRQSRTAMTSDLEAAVAEAAARPAPSTAPDRARRSRSRTPSFIAANSFMSARNTVVLTT